MGQVGSFNGVSVFVTVFAQLRDVLEWYSADFKDPMVTDPPQWFKSFIFCEALFQLPFFPVAAYAFLKGQSTQTEPV